MADHLREHPERPADLFNLVLACFQVLGVDARHLHGFPLGTAIQNKRLALARAALRMRVQPLGQEAELLR